MDGDAIFRAATQVRLPGHDTIHDLGGSTTVPSGVRYRRTRCGETALAHLTILTTRPTSCSKCDAAAMAAAARRQMLALL